mgnify:CR=1 FL=1
MESKKGFWAPGESWPQRAKREMPVPEGAVPCGKKTGRKWVGLLVQFHMNQRRQQIP